MGAAKQFSALLLILTILLLPSHRVEAQAVEKVQYFPETGHNVRGEFLQFYKKAANPKLVYGYPITEQFTSRDGKVVQYFQRARFEASTDSGKPSVRLSPLGKMTYVSGSQTLSIDNPAACRLFQSGFPVCFAFLEFFDAHGGTAQFGNPLSPFVIQENLIVQYFEKARFEWRADRPEGQRVVLTELGRLYFNQLGEDPAQLNSLPPLDATIGSILSIHAQAFVGDAITPSSGQQTVSILVQSQTNQPVSGARGKVTVRFPNGHSTDYFFTTNASGLGRITFEFENLQKGELVPIDIVVTYQGLSTKTTTSFRIWY